MKARRSDLVALGFLVAAVVMFVMSLFLVQERWKDPFSENDWVETRGYEGWVLTFEAFRFGYIGHFYTFMVAATVLGVGVTLVSPFLIGALSKSRPLWWLLITCSAVCLAEMIFGVVWWASLDIEDVFETEYTRARYANYAVPVLNFIGLLCIRKR